ncbi:hypothetical protein [Kutzneria chonburiensis]|uniref:Secreted protein n=1 Tax=Kutzneria chonburiensis TaxID=1483604 RepID=A0ABV6MZH5_9PSEU|nr:hypothetical protein [Kutzneria chonburiensis]
MSLISCARRTGLIAAAALAAAVALAVPASAAGAVPAEQAQQLQARADHYVAMGGVQVAPDRVTIRGTEVRLLAPNSPAYTCRYLHFCAYRYQNYVGEGSDVVDMLQCHEYFIPWADRGSWINNQTRGTNAVFEDSEHGEYDDSGPAPNQTVDYPWRPIYWVTPC